jgi:hypothetical protein
MKSDRRWLLALILVLAASSLYFSFPLLVEGVRSFLVILVLGGTILWALPQVLWWIVGLAFLVFWGLGIIVLSAGRELAGKKESRENSLFSGRLRAIHRTLSRGGAGWYFQDEVRNLLRSLAVDLISLKLAIPEEEARQRFQKEDWTEDLLLKTYFSGERTWEKERPGLWRRLRKPDPSDFLETARTTLERLKAYGNDSGRKGKHEPTHANP